MRFRTLHVYTGHASGAHQRGDFLRSGLFLRFRREMSEHLLHSLIKLLNVVLGLVGKGVARRSPPDEFLSVRVEQIDNQSSYFIVVNRCGCVSESTSPAPAASKAVVEGIERTLILGHLDRDDRDVTPGRHLRPAFCSQGPINGS